MSKYDELINGLTDRALKGVESAEYTIDEWDQIEEITTLLVEAELLDRAGLDHGPEVLMLKAALANYAVVGEVRAGRAVRVMLKEALTVVLGGLGELVKGLLV